jgi:hypothetical protein
MTKETRLTIKEILSKSELNRADARLLMTHLFNDSYYELHEFTNLHPIYLKEMILAIKIFSKDSQERILQAAKNKFVEPKEIAVEVPKKKPAKKIKQPTRR